MLAETDRDMVKYCKLSDMELGISDQNHAIISLQAIQQDHLVTIQLLLPSPTKDVFIEQLVYKIIS